MQSNLKPTLSLFLRPVQIVQSYALENLQFDIIAGGTVAVVLLPQAIAFAMIAELPPQMGLYAAVAAAVVGALWGSSNHLHTGPTNVASLLALSALLSVAAPGSRDYLVAAGLLAIMVGVFRVTMGVMRLGVLVNFISDSVIVGFTAGAGVLIGVNQLRHLLRLDIPSSPSLIETAQRLVSHSPETHWTSLVLGVGVIVLLLLLRRFAPKLPAPLISIVAASAAVWWLALDQQGVKVIGDLPRGLPPLVDVSLFFDLGLINKLTPSAAAVAAIGLVEAISIGRSIAGQSRQRLDSNQEFVGQGLANIAAGLFSGFLCSGSFTRSAINYEAGARTPLGSVFSSLFVFLAMFVFAPLAVYIPRTALAGVIILAAYRMIDRKEMLRIWRGARGDTAIMIATLLATLFFPLEFAVITGIVFSLAHYVFQTSIPQVQVLLPDNHFLRLIPRPERASCPQLGIVDIVGDLYFGAVSHVEGVIRQNAAQHPEQRFLLVRMRSVNHCDINGIHMLEGITQELRERGGDLYLLRVTEPVLAFMQSTGLYSDLGADHFLQEYGAVSYLFEHILDPAICIYECPVRAFKECQNLPKQTYNRILPPYTAIPPQSIPTISPQILREILAQGRAAAPLVVDVREPREFKRGHIPNSQSAPLSGLLSNSFELPDDRSVVLVCRSGRRSARAAAYILQHNDYDNLQILQGGILAWETAGLLEAVELG